MVDRRVTSPTNQCSVEFCAVCLANGFYRYVGTECNICQVARAVVVQGHSWVEVDWVIRSDVKQLHDSLHDEDKGDQSSKGLLSEASDVAYKSREVKGHHNDQHNPCPSADPQPELEVIPLICTEKQMTQFGVWIKTRCQLNQKQV